MSTTAKIVKFTDKVTLAVGDSLQNLLTGMGLKGVDKSMSSEFVDIKLTEREMEDAYASDWLVGKVCDLPPFDMTREWRTMSGDMKPERLEKFEALEKKLHMRDKYKEAMVWGRVYGGAGLIINVEDGKQPHEPLDLKNIKKGSLKHIIVSDRQFLHLGVINNDPFSENYGYPDTYRLAPSSVQIHHTRVIRFVGIPLPLQGRRRNKMWSKSLIEHMYTSLRHAAEAQENVGALLHEASVDVIKIPDLMEMLADPDTEAQLQHRFGVAKLQKSVNRMLLMDASEDYETHNQAFSGIVDVLEKFLNVVAGAADIPITRLFGQSPGGMNSTGESDLRNYYDHLSAKQEVELRHKIEYLDEIMYRSEFGEEPTTGELDFEFNPLWQMSDSESADLDEKRATRDQTYLDMNIVDEHIIARDLMEKGTYSGVDAKYVNELKKIVDEADGKGEERLDAGSFGAQLEGEEGEASENEENDEEKSDKANDDSSKGSKAGKET